jgi:cyclic pyranopterin phosphate synthase
MSDALTHLDERGRARMVDVGAKAVTHRVCIARCEIHMAPETLARITGGAIAKGDVLATARIAGIQAAKRTPDLVPLCHPLSLSGVEVDVVVDDAGVESRATVRTADRTGVEMEALTAVSVAGLTMIDMVKAIDKLAVITDVRVTAKSGGRSGSWRRDELPGDPG